MLIVIKHLSPKLIMAADDKPAILKLRKAMLLYVFGFIILFFGIWASFGYSNQIKNNVSSSSPIIPVFLLSVGAVIVLLGASDVYVSFKMMRHIDKIYNLGRYGDVVQYTGSILLILGLYSIIFSTNASLQHLGPEFTFMGYLIGFIGTLPVAMAFYKLGKRHKIFLMRVGAVAYFLFPIIGPLVLYFGLNKIIDK